MSDTFEQLVKVSGLSPIFARSVMKRTVERAGLSPETLRASEVTALLPELERALSAFLGDQTGNSLEQIRQLARRGE